MTEENTIEQELDVRPRDLPDDSLMVDPGTENICTSCE